MPRVGDPLNAAGAEATRRWRMRLLERKRPEVDAVDTAIAAAVAVYRGSAEDAGSQRDVTRATGLETMAVNYLIAQGYNAEEARRQVCRRTRRLDVAQLIPLVNGGSGGGNPGEASAAVLTPSRKPS